MARVTPGRVHSRFQILSRALAVGGNRRSWPQDTHIQLLGVLVASQRAHDLWSAAVSAAHFHLRPWTLSANSRMRWARASYV